MNLYNLSESILGTLPTEFTFLYGLLTFILACISLCLLISPFILIFKMLGGK